jgi:hypothetical protein
MSSTMATNGKQPSATDGVGRTTTEPVVVGPTVRIVRPIPVIEPQSAVAVRPNIMMIGPDRGEVVNVGPASVFVRPVVAVRVEAPPRAAWDDRGWTAEQRGHERVYRGWYHATNRRTGHALRFEGRMTQNGQYITPYIADPPPEIRQHPKAACFTLTQAPWFQVHWRRAAANVDDALLYVERVLDEAINGHR